MFIPLSGLQGQVAHDALDPVRLAERCGACDAVTKRRQLRLRLRLVEQALPVTWTCHRPVAQPRRTTPANSEAARAPRPVPKGWDTEGWAVLGRPACGVGPAGGARVASPRCPILRYGATDYTAPGRFRRQRRAGSCAEACFGLGLVPTCGGVWCVHLTNHPPARQIVGGVWSR